MKLNCNSFFDDKIDTTIHLNEYYLAAPNFNPLDPSAWEKELNQWDFITYGGYGENRADMYKNTYLARSGNFIHLGIDINVKAGTPIKCPFDAKSIDYLIDEDTEIGWGGRLTIRSLTDFSKPYLVLGHLDPYSVNISKSFNKGEIIGKVGNYPANGNVWPHLHIQAVIKISDFSKLDGYGKESDLINNPNPFEIEF